MTNVDPNDWRRQGQERYMAGKALHLENFVPTESNDHQHCEFCSAKFSAAKEDLSNGYTTADAYHWVCLECFIDFRDEMNWTLTEVPARSESESETE